jgi:hypothetical protein
MLTQHGFTSTSEALSMLSMLLKILMRRYLSMPAPLAV